MYYLVVVVLACFIWMLFSICAAGLSDYLPCHALCVCVCFCVPPSLMCNENPLGRRPLLGKYKDRPKALQEHPGQMARDHQKEVSHNESPVCETSFVFGQAITGKPKMHLRNPQTDPSRPKTFPTTAQRAQRAHKVIPKRAKTSPRGAKTDPKRS